MKELQKTDVLVDYDKVSLLRVRRATAKNQHKTDVNYWRSRVLAFSAFKPQDQ